MGDIVKQLDNPIFIGGLMKSGTTLLRKLLEVHPSIFSGLETHWFGDEFQNIHAPDENKRHQWIKGFYELTDEEEKTLRKQSTNGFDYLNNLMNFCARRAGKKRWLEKSPDNVLHVSLIHETWPDAKILLLKRNLLDVYASWKKNQKSQIRDFLEIAKDFEATIQLFSSHPSVFIVNYERLVRETRSTLEDVLNFLGEPYVEGLECYQGDSKDYDKILKITGKKSTTAESISRPIFSDSIGQWRSILDDSELKLLTQRFKIKV